MELSSEQIKIFDQIMRWFKTPEKRFVLAGYAGTGKSTLAKHIAGKVGTDRVLFCSYTGKAANVLREKGCLNSGTIHSFLYKLINEDEEGKPYFGLNYDSEMKDAKLVIVDEYSMLTRDIIADIERLSRKVLYLGDPFQLPPVNGECLLQPDGFIEQIHRQALDSPIIRASHRVRNGESLAYADEGAFRFAPKSQVDAGEYLAADQAIVGTNATRKAWNRRFRELLGMDSDLPISGDKIICLRNNRQKGIYNGMIVTATGCVPDINEKVLLSFDRISGLEVWRGDFDEVYRPSPPIHLKYVDRFDFGYAITCHKSQGSEFDTVVIYNEPVGREPIERQRWLYTALTRAKEKVILIDPGK